MKSQRNYSRKRAAILAKLRSTNCHPSADWIYQELRADFPDLSLGTVYRNLAVFRQDGDIISVGTVNGQERFDGTVKPHPHFMCDVCGAVADVDVPVSQEELLKSVKASHKVEIDYLDVTFHGTCEACLKARGQSDAD